MLKSIRIVVVASLILSACAPLATRPSKEPTPRASAPVESANWLFGQAENLYAKAFYEKALPLYEAYAEKYPDGAFSDTALLKIGHIHLEANRYQEAADAYDRLIALYPQSMYVPDARVQRLAAYLGLQRHTEVIDSAKEVLNTVVSRTLVLATYQILGDAYRAVANFLDAVGSYAMALNIASPAEAPPLISKIEEAAPHLSSSDLTLLMENFAGNPAESYLIFHLGLNLANKERLEDSLALLSRFVDLYPEHKYAPFAKDLIAELNRRAQYDRHTIACLLPLTGRYRVFGLRALRGIEFAFDRINAENAVSDLKLIVKDTGGDPATAAAAVRSLAAEKVAAIIGPMVTAEEAAAEAQKLGLPIMVMTQKEEITGMGDYVFRNFITPEMQVKSLVTYAVEMLGIRRFAILYPQEPYGETFMNLFWDEIISHDAKVVGAESYHPEDTDFADPIERLVGLYYPEPRRLRARRNARMITFDHMEEHPGNALEQEKEIDFTQPEAFVDFEAIFIPDSPKKAGLIIPQLPYRDVVNVFLLGTNLWHSEKLIEMANDYLNHVIVPDAFFSESDSAAIRTFVEDFQRIYGSSPSFIEAVAYDTTRILLELAVDPTIHFRSTIKDRLVSGNGYDGITGRTFFDAKGEAHKNLFLLRVAGNRFQELPVE